MQQQIGSDAFGAAPTLLISVLARRRFTVASLRYARRALRNQCARKVLAPRLFKLGEHFIVPHSGHNKMLRVPRAIGPGSTIPPLFGVVVPRSVPHSGHCPRLGGHVSQSYRRSWLRPRWPMPLCRWHRPRVQANLSWRDRAEHRPLETAPNLDPDKGQGLPDRGQGLPDRGQGLPDRGHGLPDRGQGLPDRGQGLPDRGQGLPDTGQGLPDKGQHSPDSRLRRFAPVPGRMRERRRTRIQCDDVVGCESDACVSLQPLVATSCLALPVACVGISKRMRARFAG